jgi:hypothetical protein
MPEPARSLLFDRLGISGTIIRELVLPALPSGFLAVILKQVFT